MSRSKTKLSDCLYNVDMAMCHSADSAQKRNIYEVLRTQQQPKKSTDDELLKKYVRTTANGYEVYNKDFGHWVTFSKTSEINVRIDRTPGSPPVMYVKAHDSVDNKHLEFRDEHILTPHVLTQHNMVTEQTLKTICNIPIVGLIVWQWVMEQ